MAVDLHSNDVNVGASANALFAHHENGSATSGLSDHVSSFDAGVARGSAKGPSGFFRYRILKRALDIFLVILFSPILIPLLLLIAAAVRVSSPGPVFFSHRRIHSHAKFFTMWKFRTMCVNSAEVLENHLAAHPDARIEWHKTHKLKNDPRITRVGLFLRRASLDELPQLWNVFNGTMSLVGPRPIVAAEVEKYGDGFASYCAVKPGITGLWQVSGRSSTSYENRVNFDRTYASTWSFTGDLLILCKTLLSVANQDGAY
jgi:lipopolysaccharide/colanic/teichoic acid biosynthesis glycosyltransferase